MLRRSCARALALALLLTLPAALAEGAAPEFDLDRLTLHQLYALRERVDAQIAALEDAEAARCFEDGAYLVGRDIPEGDYVVIERQDAMFASVVVRAAEAADSPLILHKLVGGRAVIRLRRDTWVTLSEARAWPLGREPDARAEDGSVGEGGYLVGVQLDAGRYVAAPTDKAPLSSYSIYDAILGADAQLNDFEILHEAVELELREGEYIELSGCALTPVGASRDRDGEE